MTRRQNKDRAINNNPHRNGHGWCPVCESDQKFRMWGVWITGGHDGNSAILVCTYGVCGSCREQALQQDCDTQEETAKIIQRRLVQRYPELEAKTPWGY